ncbi:bumetanide-sensitive sodium-(potassium)-chloride cotransporter isoform X2 [Cephus cinctus]|nr:bumetanide-sensitive sodium-(potassium)-chloride cotransporter isoform X2 [Cephus cinctus]XP_015596445.1 bumetanide-sensitive sodium-(potassium)-chloride cotransporter isoform X2 [Cephus cinctus]XP_024941402.1 bumetanide-sensitive sodium-(potassium)-chloride cotransporter isoform X2 [Cephus cinctus]XP_024941403.1 bumetanide-sensitive sodium-(potassium)-chloride cotransporter isoform X2 [Cephus cinctus]XP_024941404.1 bumetanide-sensitive sodium-(potassium)-chloride cotransporter isoform X2 [C
MEGIFQSRNREDSDAASGEPNNKRSPTLTLNVNGLWDVVPRLDHYRLSRRAKRPSLSDLHEGNPVKDPNLESGLNGTGQLGLTHGIKLGWIQGVLIPCLLNIWGVMLFLRLSWVVAQAGIFHSIVIIVISTVVCVITTLSLSAICTNGEVKGGGIYFIISRSLGPEFGASVGIVFAFANAVAASMNTIGFCNSLNELVGPPGIYDNDVNDVRIIGVIAILVMVLICAVGMEWESKAQNFLIAVIVLAILDFVVGAVIGPTDISAESKGFVGFSSEVFKENWISDYRYSEKTNQTFFSVFAIFFPSVTGIQAGANISGDLKDPASSIPVGTLLALLISMGSYFTFVLFAGGAALRDASGEFTGDFIHECIPKDVLLASSAAFRNATCNFNGNIVNVCVSESVLLTDGAAFRNASCNFTGSIINDCIPKNCTYGLHNSYSMMQIMSVWGPLIYAGCFAATLSTALTNLLSVPRLIQALGRDRIYPGLIYFSKGYGKAGEPYRGYVLTFFVAAGFLLIADLNAVAPLISNFYLASYALINFCTFHAALIRPLGWRPTFKYYNTWLSLMGFILCVAIMFLIDWVTSLVTFVIIFGLYLVVVYRKPDVNWGDSTQAQTYKTALSIVYKLNSIDEHVKNYAPQILTLTGPPCSRPALLHLANLITKNNSLLLAGEVYSGRLSYRARGAHLRQGYSWLQRHRIKSFYHVVEGLSLEKGAAALMQATGVGKLAPNVVLMGYKTHWATCNQKELQEYFNVLHNTFDQRLAVAILRIAEGLSCSGLTYSTALPDDEQGTLAQSSYELAGNTLMHADSNLSMGTLIPRVQSVPTIGTEYPSVEAPTMARNAQVDISVKDQLKNKKKHATDKILLQNALNTVPEYMTIFQKKHKHGTIDVWWLYDDGGLTILLPYIISTRSNWEHCKMRIFALANHKQEIVAQEKEMAEIMAKFRIKYTSLKMVDDISTEPRKETQRFFDKLISDFRKNDTSDTSECVVTDAELDCLREKTNRQLRLRELLLENSSESTLVVMSLPMPRKGAVSAPLYMAWLEALTRDMPPTLLVRGNHTSVLTFYS